MSEKLIKKCIQLARRGIGFVHPNPLVGCIIVKNGEILAEGCHQKYGGDHAEIDALNKVTGKVKGSTLYVNLEPCCFQGKTPACTDRIIKEGIKEVFIGTLDPNPKVNGKAIKIFKDAGIKVEYGILEKECEELNKKFFYAQKNQMPYVLLKLALSENLKMTNRNKERVKITNHYSDKIVHKWRSEYDAVLVGSGTIISDNPKLTVRNLDRKRNPHRIVLDREEKLDLSKYHVFNDEHKNKTILVTSHNKKASDNGIQVTCKNNKLDLKQLFKELYKKKIYSVIIEGGIELTKTIIAKNLAQEIAIFIGQVNIKEGISPFKSEILKDLSSELHFSLENIKRIDGDRLINYQALSSNEN